jgi:Phospholipase_D-nuclease N-terminal
MSKSGKLLVGILSFLPIILLIAYMIVFFSFFITIFRHAQQEDVLPGMMIEHIAWIVGVALLMGFISLGLKIYFIIHAINNKAADNSERIVWILVFIFAGMIGFPVYWYMRIWKAPEV